MYTMKAGAEFSLEVRSTFDLLIAWGNKVLTVGTMLKWFKNMKMEQDLWRIFENIIDD